MLSISQIKMFDCPRKYKFRYIDKLPTKKTPALVCGSIQDFAMQKMYENDFDLKVVKDAVDCYIADNQENWSDVEWKGDDAKRWTARTDLNTFKTYLINILLPAYFNSGDALMPRILANNESALQVKITTAITERTEIGYIDMIAEGKKGDILVDFKTTSITPQPEQWENDIQLIYYVYGYSQMFKKMPEKVVYEFFILNKTPKFARIEFNVSQAQIDSLIEDFKLFNLMIDNGIFFRNRTKCFDYASKCEYYENCFSKKKLLVF